MTVSFVFSSVFFRGDGGGGDEGVGVGDDDNEDSEPSDTLK